MTGIDHEKLGLKLMATKYDGWKHEDEIRLVVSLDQVDPETGLYFCAFGHELVLRQVIVGARSNLSKNDVSAALSSEDARVIIVKARLAFQTFTVAQQRNARLWSK